jgi:hypothetical protein
MFCSGGTVRKKGYKAGTKAVEPSTDAAAHEEGMGMRTGTGVFRQLENGTLAPVAARRSKEEAQSLIASLEAFWPGPYVLRELPPLSLTPTE